MEQAATMGPTAAWRSALEEGRFMLQRDRRSGAFTFPPRVAVPHTLPADLEWVEACGRGVVYATSVIYPRPPLEPYAVVLVDLEEGPRMMSRIDGVDAQAIEIGMPVTAAIADGESGPMVVFHKA